MSEKTEIAWTDSTFNPWWGCTPVDEGCRECYAERWAKRTGLEWGPKAPRRMMSHRYWNEPHKWNQKTQKEGKRWLVFCGSMCDIWEDRPELAEPRERLYRLIEETAYLTWLLLTKRPENALRMAPERWKFVWPQNVWAGATVAMQKNAPRILSLSDIPVAKRFVSAEPLLEALNLFEYGYVFDLVIIGGESGPKARPCNLEWIRAILAQCKVAGVPCFVKQLGTRPIDSSMTETIGGDGKVHYRQPYGHPRAEEHRKLIAEGKASGYSVRFMQLNLRDRKGADLDEWPEDLRVREFPEACCS